MAKLIGPGYFYKIVFNRGEDPWLFANSTIMFFPTGDIPPTDGRIVDEARRKLSEIYDTKIAIHHFYMLENKTTFLV